MEPEADRHDAVLVISAWRELDSHPSFRARVLAGASDEQDAEEYVVTTHAELLDVVARWLGRRMPEA